MKTNFKDKNNPLEVVEYMLELDKILTKFRDNSLLENANHRSGNTRRFVYTMTRNLDKLREQTKVFDLYGIELIPIPFFFA